MPGRPAPGTEAEPETPPAPQTPPIGPSEWWSLGRLWVVVGLFVLVGLIKSASIDIPFRDPRGEWLASRLTITIGLLVALPLLDAWWRNGRNRRGLVATLRSRWSVARAAVVIGALAAYHSTYFVYHNLKSWDVFNNPRDAWLTKVDEALFLGHSPASLLHELLGTHVAAYFLTAWYESFGTIVVVSFVACVVLCTRMRQGLVFLASMVWVWILGVASYYAIPSLGPFNESPGDFAALPHTVVKVNQAKYMAQRADLLADPSAPGAAAQVSAFASLHVGVSCVIWLMLGYYGFRTLFALMGLYVALTVVATIYLGWHFFLDDVAGVLIAVASVRLGRWVIYPRRAEEERERAQRTRRALVAP